MKNLLFFLLLFAAFIFSTGCNNSDEPGDGPNEPGICTATVYSERVLVAFQNFETAVLAYTNDPTPANCADYRDAATEYLDALKTFETCTFLVNDADYQESLREAQEEVDNIQC